MPIIATAGHVDHGKSTLVEAITGRDPDRWAEEKERGLTIDLGFGWQQIGGFDVGFVDVPGHERFIKNMLAGVGAIDVALLVVAADEGWMPQSEEHLAVLDLLDTRHGVIAVTRVDLTDDDTVDLTELEILEKVEGTSLADWPIVRLSPVTGLGMDVLLTALIDQLTAAGKPRDMARPRLWIDRSFRISGAGMVVTGTLAGGSLAAGDDLVLLPQGTSVRIRGMQHHDAPADSLQPGTRAALNITGTDEVGRGMMLARPDAFATTNSFLGTLRQVRNLDEDLTARGAYHLHVGSGSWPVRIRLLEPDVCIVKSTQPVPIQAGDRYILRETGRRAVVAGGRVLDPHPAGSGRTLRQSAIQLREAVNQEPDRIADALLEVRGTASLLELHQDSGGGSATTPFATSREAMAPQAAARLVESVAKTTTDFHARNRLRPGIPKAELASSLGVTTESVAMVVAGSNTLVDDGATVRSVDFSPGLSAAEAAAWDTAQEALSADLAAPRASQLGLETELIHALVRDGRLVRIDADLVYLPQQVDRIKAALHKLPDEFTVADFRDHLGVTRRQAVPLLEWLDKQGITRRRGDLRSLRA
jgi:selenocysteine-specific elongation factor